MQILLYVAHHTNIHGQGLGRAPIFWQGKNYVQYILIAYNFGRKCNKMVMLQSMYDDNSLIKVYIDNNQPKLYNSFM